MHANTRCDCRRPEMEGVEPRWMLAVDLLCAMGFLPPTIPTGNTTNLAVIVTNSGTTAASGSTTVVLERMNGPVWDLIGTATVRLKIAGGGGTQAVAVPMPVAADAAAGAATVRATINPTGAIAESNLANNTTPPVAANIGWVFGTVPSIGVVTLRAKDPNTGNIATFSMTGPGMGTLVDGGHLNLWNLTLTGTTRKSSVKVTGAIALEAITAATMVGSIRAPQADFKAAAGFEASLQMTFTRGLLSLTMHDSLAMAAIYHVVTVGNADMPKDALTLVFNNADDLRVDSQMPIASLTAARFVCHYHNAANHPGIYTPAFIGSVAIKGDFTGVSGGASYPLISAGAANPRTGLGVAAS